MNNKEDRIWKMHNPVNIFADKRCEIDPKAIIPKREAYEIFKKFCEENRFFKETYPVFGRKLKQQFPTIRAVRRTIKGKRMWCYQGIKITRKDTDFDENI